MSIAFIYTSEHLLSDDLNHADNSPHDALKMSNDVPNKPDVSDYQKLQLKVLEQEEELKRLRLHKLMFNSLLELFPDFIYFKDTESRFICVGDTFMTHYQEKCHADLIGKTDFDIFADAHAQAAFDDEQDIIQSGKVITGLIEEELWNNGSSSWVSTTKAPLRDEEGNIIGTFGISRDITAQVTSEEKLTAMATAAFQEKSLLDTVLNLIPDSIFAKDAQSRFIISNKAHYSSFGFTCAEQILGKTDFDLFPVHLANGFVEGESGVIHDNKKIINREELGENPLTKETLWITSSKSPLRYQGIKGLVGYAKDITPFKAAMTTLEQARQSAEGANRTKTEFLAKMSHEMRTPLNGIIGLTELTLTSDLTNEQNGNLSLVNNSAHHLLYMIGDLLDYSTLQVGKTKREDVDFNLITAIEDIFDIVFFENNEADVELAFIAEPAVPDTIHSDPNLLRQIFINLLGNAKKFTNKGHIILRVCALTSGNNRKRLNFSIEDTGIGVKAEQLNNIFNIFTQEDDSITRRFGGTGLGLSICKELVELLGGSIQAKSAKVGSIFSFDLPLIPSVSNISTSITLPSDCRKQIMFLGNSKFGQEAFSKLLAKTNLSVVTPDNLNSVIYTLETKKIDLIFVEYNLLCDNEFTDISKAILLSDIRVILIHTRHSSIYIPDNPFKRVYEKLDQPIRKNNLFKLLTDQLIPSSNKVQNINIENTIITKLKKFSAQSNILLVEDNPVNQKVVIAILTQVGFNVDSVENGQLAIEANANKPYDLILMDLQMPIMDGLTATELIRSDKQFSHIPIIALTAQALKGDKEACINAGMNDYITKPIQPDTLYHTLYNWVGMKNKPLD